MKSNRARFARSLGGELMAQANRVRDLIGSRHWPSDGFHKEFLLRAVFERHLPPAAIVSHGFVIDPVDDEVSREVDLLILSADGDGLPFHQGELSIVFPASVLAALSIKTACSRDTMADVVANLMSVEAVWRLAQGRAAPWLGAFFFDVDELRIGTFIELFSSELEKVKLRPIPLSPAGDVCVPACAVTLGGLVCLTDVVMDGGRRRLRIRGLRVGEAGPAAFFALAIEAIVGRLGGSSAMADFVEKECAVEEEASPRFIDFQ